jgi:hypothetical protein
MFYAPPGQLLAVDVRTDTRFVIGKPRSMPRGFFVNGTGTPGSYDVTPDGRFIGVVDSTLPQPGSAAAQRRVELDRRAEAPCTDAVSQRVGQPGMIGERLLAGSKSAHREWP